MNKTLLSLILCCTVVFAQAQDDKKLVDKIMGEKSLPSITLNSIEGKPVNIADYGKSGKITLVSFWATWCVPCKKELTNIAELYDEWKKKYNMQIVAVSIDDSRSSTKVKPTVEGQRWEYDVLLDVNQDLKRQLNIQSVPFSLLVDASGKIVYTHSGYVDGDEYVVEEEMEKLIKN